MRVLHNLLRLLMVIDKQSIWHKKQRYKKKKKKNTWQLNLPKLNLPIHFPSGEYIFVS